MRQPLTMSEGLASFDHHLSQDELESACDVYKLPEKCQDSAILRIARAHPNTIFACNRNNHFMAQAVSLLR